MTRLRLGEIARVSRGLSTGNALLYIMTREKAKTHKLLSFVRPIITSAREFPITGPAIVQDNPKVKVILLTNTNEINANPALQNYLGTAPPCRLSSSSTDAAPILATYVGIPRFVANPDSLLVNNSLYKVKPFKEMDPEEIRLLVDSLNLAVANLPKQRYAERWTPTQVESLVI